MEYWQSKFYRLILYHQKVEDADGHVVWVGNDVVIKHDMGDGSCNYVNGRGESNQRKVSNVQKFNTDTKTETVIKLTIFYSRKRSQTCRVLSLLNVCVAR
jgi:hypothetical protein